jgi:hypothetical protein
VSVARYGCVSRTAEVAPLARALTFAHLVVAPPGWRADHGHARQAAKRASHGRLARLAPRSVRRHVPPGDPARDLVNRVQGALVAGLVL